MKTVRSCPVLGKVMAFLFCISTVFALTLPGMAVSIYRSGQTSGSALFGQLNYNLRGRVGYTSNTANSITIEYIGLEVKNTGTPNVDLGIDECAFTATNAQRRDQYEDLYFDEVLPGEQCSHSSPSWAGVLALDHNAKDKSPTYLKYGDAAEFDATVGKSGARGSVMMYSRADCTFIWKS